MLSAVTVTGMTHGALEMLDPMGFEDEAAHEMPKNKDRTSYRNVFNIK